jgi:hypothetical protein
MSAARPIVTQLEFDIQVHVTVAQLLGLKKNVAKVREGRTRQMLGREHSDILIREIVSSTSPRY